MILNSNQSFATWGDVFGDGVIAIASTGYGITRWR